MLQRASTEPIHIWLGKIAEAAALDAVMDHFVDEAFQRLTVDDDSEGFTERIGPETSADELHRAYLAWLKADFNSEHTVNLANFRLLLAAVGNDSAEKWCRKFASSKADTFDTVEMVRHRLGPEALPGPIQAALGHGQREAEVGEV